MRQLARSHRQMETHVREVRGYRRADPRKPHWNIPSEYVEIRPEEDTHEVTYRNDAKHNTSSHEERPLPKNRSLPDVPPIVNKDNKECDVEDERRQDHVTREVNPHE